MKLEAVPEVVVRVAPLNVEVLGMCMTSVWRLIEKWTRWALGSTLLLIRVPVGPLSATLVSMFRIRLTAEPADSGPRLGPLTTARRIMLLNRPV